MLGLLVLNPEVKDYSFFFLIDIVSSGQIVINQSVGVVSNTSEHLYHETAMQPQLSLLF